MFIISATSHHITSILELWTHLSDPQTWLAYRHASVIFAKCRPLISHLVYGRYLFIHSSYCFHIEIANSPKWPSDLTSILHYFSNKCQPRVHAQNLLMSCPNFTRQLHITAVPKQTRQLCWIFSSIEGGLMEHNHILSPTTLKKKLYPIF